MFHTTAPPGLLSGLLGSREQVTRGTRLIVSEEERLSERVGFGRIAPAHHGRESGFGLCGTLGYLFRSSRPVRSRMPWPRKCEYLSLEQNLSSNDDIPLSQLFETFLTQGRTQRQRRSETIMLPGKMHQTYTVVFHKRFGNGLAAAPFVPASGPREEGGYWFRHK